MSPTVAGMLPLEVWRMIFDYLEPRELCACSCVSNSWRHLIDSLDTRTWKRHFLNRFPWVVSPEWSLNRQFARRESSWYESWQVAENFNDSEDEDFENDEQMNTKWKTLYLREMSFNKAWKLDSPRREQAACVGVLRRRRKPLADILRASPNPADLRSLRMAVSQAKAYATVELEPGLHEDSSRLDLNRPVHLCGVGPPGSVVISVAFVIYTTSVRLSNLVLRAPWFTECMLQVHEGTLQAENCRFELGEVALEFADGVCYRHCSFERCLINAGRTGPMLIENCVFHHPDGDCINVNFPPMSSLPRTPICQFLYQQSRQRWPQIPPKSRSAKTTQRPEAKPNRKPEVDKKSPKADRSQSLPVIWEKKREIMRSAASASGVLEEETKSSPEIGEEIIEDEDDEEDNLLSSELCEKWQQVGNNEAPPGPAPVEYRDALTKQLIARYRRKCWRNARKKALQHPEVRRHLIEMASSACVHIHRCVFHQTHTGVTIVQGGEVSITHCRLMDLQCAVRALGTTRVVLYANQVRRCSQSAFILRNGASGVIAANSIEEVQEAAMEVRRRSDPVILHNRIRFSRRCGIVCLTQSNPIIQNNVISHQGETGIHILYKADPVISSNLIIHSRGCGIAISGDGRGVIAENLVAYHDTCGVNIYKLGDPLVRNNLIMSCAGVGVLIRDEGSGMISDNVIYGSVKAGVCLHSPFMCQVHGNRISNSDGDGVIVVPDVQAELDLGRDNNAENADLGVPGPRRRYYLFDPTDDDEDQPWISWDQRMTLIDRNSIVFNHGCGLQTLDNVPLDLHSNFFHSNLSHGISLRIPGLLTSQRTLVTVKDNLVTENGGCGVYGTLTSLSGGKIEVQGNGVYDNAFSGLLLRSIPARVEENDVFGNVEAAVTLEGEFHIRFAFNRLHATPAVPTLRLSTTLRGKIVHNVFYSTISESLHRLLNEMVEDDTEVLLKCFDNRRLSLPQTRRGAADSFSKRVVWAPSSTVEPKPRPLDWRERERLCQDEREERSLERRGTRRRRATMSGVVGCGPRSLMCVVI